MSLRVEIDWARNGYILGAVVPSVSLTPGPTLVPSDSGSDVTSRVRTRSGAISLEYGRDQSTALAPTVAGRGSLVLENSDRALSPRNVASPFYGYLKPSRPVRITRTLGGGLTLPFVLDATAVLGSGEATYTLFTGHTDDNPINPDLDSKKASISLVDNLADFRGLNITTPVYSGIRTGQAIGYILDAAGWSADLRDLDAGATVIPWFWVDNKDALTAMEEVLRSEGTPAMLTVGTDGSIIFKDRHHRLIDTPSLTSQATWRNIGAEPLMNKPFNYDEAWRNIVNTGTISVDVRSPKELEAVWTADDIFSLSAGELKLFTVSTTDPFINAIDPEAGTDYTVTAGAVTVTLVRSSGSSAVVKVLAGPSGATVQGLQVRAQPISVSYTLQISAEDAGSVSDYGPRSYPSDLPWCNQYDAQAVLSAAVAQRAQPSPVVEARFMIGNDRDRSSAILVRDLSEMVTVVESETVLNDPFYIESIRHDLTGEHDHSVTFGLEMAPVPPSPIFTLDTAGAGLDAGKLGGGFSDPAKIFILGSTVSGHRLGEGVLAL